MWYAFITVSIVSCSFALKGFWALWYNVKTVVMPILLMEVFAFYVLLCGNNALKQETVHSSMTCYVHVIVYNTVRPFRLGVLEP
jgi:hypothetical protein